MIAARVLATVLSATLFFLVIEPTRAATRLFGRDWAPWAPKAFQRILLKGLRIRLKVEGSPAPGPHVLLVPNHVSWLDVPVLGAAAPMTFLAKSEVGESRLARLLTAAQGTIFVERGRRTAIPRVNAAMAAAMTAGRPVVLFAEATTGDGNRLLPFHSSHFESLRPGPPEAGRFVQPVFLDYARRGGTVVDRRERPRIAWYGDMTFSPHLLQFLAGPPVECVVTFLEPWSIPPDFDRKGVARETRRRLRDFAAERHRT